MEKLVYKYNGDTQIIRFNSAEKFNEYLVKNISEIELVEDVEVIDLCAPVEVKEAPVEAPKAEVIVKTFIEEFDFLVKDGRTDILEQITDWLIANVVDDELFIEYCNSKAVTTISDNELAKSILKDRGCILEAPKADIKFQDVIQFLDDNEEEDTQPVIDYITENHLSDDDIIDLADKNSLTIINDEDLAVDYLSEEGYACLNTASDDLKDNIYELINHY